MSVQVENLEKNMAKLTIEVSASDFEDAMQKAYLKNKGKITLPGFRKGKVPRAMIEKMYGSAFFYEDAANSIIPGAYEDALKDVELDIVSRPEIDVTQIEKGKDFIFTATIAVKPEVTLGQYKGLEHEAETVFVSEDDIAQELKKVQEQNSRTVSVEGRAVENGDISIIDFEGFVDGEAFEGGKGTDFELVIGSHSFIDTFEEQLIGKNIGEELEVNVTFPEDYQAAELAGKPALFKVTIKDLKVKELPELDDELASDISDFDTLEEYKEDVKKNLLDKKEKDAKTAKENALVDKVIEDSEMELPEPMIDAEVDGMINDLAQRMQMQGLSMDQYMQYTGLTPDKLKDQMRPNAEKRIKTRLVLEAIADAEDIQISEEELEKELDQMASMYKMELDKLKELMGDTEKANIKKDLAVQKAVDVIAESVK